MGIIPTVQRRSSKLVWNSEQTEFLDDFDDWLNSTAANRRLFYYLAGYAGTGKTELAREAARRADGEVVFIAPTGKAAARMREAGCEGADTIDSVIYRRAYDPYCGREPPCVRLCDGRCRYLRERFIGKELNPDSVAATAKLLAGDEISMVPGPMAEDILSFGTPLLALGDPGQLAPVYGNGYFTSREPDFFLTQIHRQLEHSPIIALATAAREGRRLHYGDYEDSEVTDRPPPPREMIDFDIVIVGTNETRRRINRQCRRALGFKGDVPQPGERLVCLKNDRAKNLRNGTIWTCIEAFPDRHDFIDMVVADEDGHRIEVIAPAEGFEGEGNGGDLPKNPFDFGYCLTAHKSQGSQWDAVLVFDESAVFRRDRHKWLYTALTRAAERVVVVRP